MFTTKDPDKAAIKVTTSDPSKGFGADTLFKSAPEDQLIEEMKRKQGAPQTMKKGGKVKASSASKRADGCAVKGKTRGRMV
jgi:hypothetical protein